jgi:CRP-like cAMP-binding protein
VAVLAAATPSTQRRLAEHVERLRLPDRSVITVRGRPVHWVAIAVDGLLAGGGRTWSPGDTVFLAEGLLHGIAPATVVARGEAEVALVPIRALTAAMSTDPSFGLAVARAVAGATLPSARPTPRLDHRRHRGRLITVWPAA